MKACRRCAAHRANREAIVGMALSRYQFATPEVRTLMRTALGHAISGRTLKRLVRASGCHMKRGRPRSTPHIHKGDLNDLIELTSNGLVVSGGNALQLFEEVQIQFGLRPRQYVRWVAKHIRRGKCMMRKCIFCDGFFPSQDSGERYCKTCRGSRRAMYAS